MGLEFRNEASWDRALRTLVGAALLLLGWSGAVGGTIGMAFQLLGFVPLLTGLCGWCPAYELLGLRTGAIDADRRPAARRPGAASPAAARFGWRHSSHPGG